MDINLQPNNEQVDLADKKEGKPYMLVVAVILLGIMTAMYYNATKNNRVDNLAQAQEYKGENRELKAENKLLRSELLRAINDCSEEKEQLTKNTDSVIREAYKKGIKSKK